MKKVSYIDSNFLSPKDAWDSLSMAEKSEMMKVAVQNGITNLDDIRREYNEFAGGGYMDKAKALIKKNEGWMAKPYKDAPKGKSWRSVGYGFNDSGFYDKYPEGISRHYENGITKAQAEQELNYVLNKADKHLRSIYGKQWDSFNDNQKAAIMDTYYQRPASVGKKSAFYNAVKSGKDASKYLGVNGFADRNKKRQSVFGGGAAPMVADNIDTSLPQEVALQPIVENIPEFIPLNPQAFNTTLPTYQRPELTFEEPVVQETSVSPYSPEELERQERAEGLANLGRFLSFTNTSGSNNAFLNTIGMLTGNVFAEGGDTNDADLVDWIIREEGFNKKPEDIGDGKITLGSGLTDPKWHALYKKRGNKWSEADNRMAVAEEVANRRRWAEKNIPNWDTLPDSAQKALLSYKYNYNFTSVNSPKLFQALRDSNLYEAAKQMDATSKDPKFKKGLIDRRKREQEWFLSDVTGNAAPTQAIPIQAPVTINTSMIPLTEPAVSTAVRSNYVPATTTPYNRGNNMRRAFESAVAFNRMMDATSLQNNPLPEYQFPIEYADGGKIHIKPSHRGRLTELKKRTGKSEAELYKTGGPAVRKMITFARNARKWKHDLGGNLFDDGGSYSYTKPLDNVIVDEYGNLLDPNIPSARGTVQLPEVIATTRDPRKPVPTAFDGSITPWLEVGEMLAKPLNVFSPSQQFGAVADAVQDKRNYFESVFNGNSGFFTDQYAQEHPYITMAGNLGGDILSGATLSKVPRLTTAVYKNAIEPGMRLFNSPLTGNWTKIGNREYRLSPSSLGANGSSLESRNINPEEDVTENLLKWLGRDKSYKPKNSISTSSSIEDLIWGMQNKDSRRYNGLIRMAEEWKKAGVDFSRISIEDLSNAYDKRGVEILKSHPERYSKVEPTGYGSFRVTDIQGLMPVGNYDLYPHYTGNMYIGNIHNLTRMSKTPVRGVQERGLNSAINIAQSEGRNGVVTGELYQSAPKQLHVVEKYPDRKVIGNTGEHSNVNMVTDHRKRLGLYDDNMEYPALSREELMQAGEEVRKFLSNQPFWLLEKPTYHVPTKSIVFDPRIIDGSGKMHMDWSNPNIFKSMLYPMLIGTSTIETTKNR